MNRLRELRNKHHLSLRELAERVNMSYSNIASIERGEVSLNENTTNLFCNFFNVSADYLLGNTDNPNPTKIVDIEVWEQDGTITKLQHELLDLTKGFTVDDFQMVNSYIEFLKSKKDESKNEK